MSSAFELSHDQVANLILHYGSSRSVHVEGHMGSSKSSILKTLAKLLPNHIMCYFDCNTKTLGDVSLPSFHKIDDQGYVSFVPNEELGVHLGKPICLLIDELPKAEDGVKKAMTRIMQEKIAAGIPLHKSSITWSTGNHDGEGVGDSMPKFLDNRVTIVSMRKSTNVEFIEYGINAGFHPILLGVAKEYADWFADFRDVKDPKDNEAIFHPDAPERRSFWTNRSAHAASDLLYVQDKLDQVTFQAALIGTVGAYCTGHIMAFSKLHGDLPSLESIKKDPHGARVPDSMAARCMVIHRTCSNIDPTWVDAWFDYMVRMDKESQGFFNNTVKADSYDKKKQAVVMNNKKYRDWALANNHLATADKR
jgi:hypothetical protein